MPNPARIFISSAYDEKLVPLRLDLKRELEEAGHSPLLFEDNFYPWQTDFMKTCLQKVMESDIFILLLNENVGTYWEEDKCTPTYQEFRIAIKEGKYVIAFLDSDVKQIYEEHIRKDLDRRYKKYIEEKHRNPDYTIDIVYQVINEDLGKSQREKIESIHPFIWAFIYDVQAARIWTEELVLAQAPKAYKKIKGYLSDRLGEGIKLVPMKEDIHDNAIAAQDFTVYQDYTLNLLSYLHMGTITDWGNFLETAMEPLVGDYIYQRPATMLAEEIGKFEKCNALTVYKKAEDKIRLCGYAGATSPSFEYDLTNDDSYVVSALTRDTNVIGYSEDKNVLYYAITTKDYVLCFHYPMDQTWSNTKVEAFKEEIEYAIINTTTLYTDFLADLIGGIQYDWE
ncbi:hypothetical protein B4102_4131 [Heyndrickxia sporothermodurans]|uniref:DUF4062 domain-containing protein n=1 Tax=Heyndrickxia sporothermodurans TaxID=46224 RepID=A0A150KK76_9BACI|nr:DUF4062 domain-containing protein [Heyndrickxia sporothermodurans]KYC85299.1 hypothetical protein B4102_4131 [Heyndrickxia sporothermodurans]